MPQIFKKTVEVDELAPFERVQQQTVYVPMPQILKATVEEVRLSSHEQVGFFQHVDVPPVDEFAAPVYRTIHQLLFLT